MLSAWLRRFFLIFVLGLILSTTAIFAVLGLTHYHLYGKAVFARELKECVEASPEDLSGKICFEFMRRVQSRMPSTRIEIWLIDAQNNVVNSVHNPKPPFNFQRYIANPADEHDFHRIDIDGYWSPILIAAGFINFDDHSDRRILIGDYYDHSAAALSLKMFSKFAFLVLAIGAAIAASWSFWQTRKRSKEAQSVLKRLRSGEMDARFSIEVKDDFTQVVRLSNLMIDEVMHMVQRLKHAESSRLEMMNELAHDLRTPLTSLRSFSELIIDPESSLSETVKTECAQAIAKEVVYLENLISDLFILAKMEDPSFQLNVTQVNLQLLLKEVVDEFSRRISLNNESLNLNLKVSSPEIPGNEIQGDPFLLKRLFRNLLENSARYAKKNINIELKSLDQSKFIIIYDDGPGFAPENLAQFGQKRFSRNFDNSTGIATIGLGSVIAARISNMHGGRIDALNDADGGARVLVTLNPISS